jgi:hypothetical protein
LHAALSLAHKKSRSCKHERLFAVNFIRRLRWTSELEQPAEPVTEPKELPSGLSPERQTPERRRSILIHS